MGADLICLFIQNILEKIWLVTIITKCQVKNYLLLSLICHQVNLMQSEFVKSTIIFGSGL